MRLMDTAIQEWFFTRDPFVTHLLACACYFVLYDLGKDNGKAPPITKRFVPFSLGTVYDFLRYADSGVLTDSVDLVPEVNQWMLFDAITSFEMLFGGRTALMRTFDAYYALHPSSVHAHLCEHAAAFLPKGITIEQASAFGRLEFFGKVSEMFTAQIGTVT